MVDMNTAVRTLVQASRELEPANREMVSHWGPDKVPRTLLMAEFAQRFASSLDLISESERKRILELCEYLLAEGDHTVKRSVVTGFFEALLAHSDLGHFNFHGSKQ